MSKLMYKGLELRTRTSSYQPELSDDDIRCIEEFVPKDIAEHIQGIPNDILPFVLNSIGYDTTSLLISARRRA